MSKTKGELKLDNGMTMVMDYNAFAEYEDMMNGENPLTVLDSFTDPTKISFSKARALYCAALKTHQPGITLQEAGRVFQEYPNALFEAVGLSFGNDETTEAAPEGLSLAEATSEGNEQPPQKKKK